MSSREQRPKTGGQRRTWNTPEVIAEHRAMTPAQRIKKMDRLSREARKMATARRVDDT